MLRLLRHASAEARWIVSASDSEHVRELRGAESQRRVLLLSPRLNLVDATAARVEPLTGYTDIVVPGNAFIAATEARFPGARVHAVGLPVFAELASDASRALARSELATACPQSVGKRVVVITTQRSPERLFGESSVRQLAERLPDDVFLVLDVPDILSSIESETADLEELLFVNDGALGLFSLLASGDTLLTSKFRDAVYFSATGRGLFLLNTPENVGTMGDKLPDAYSRLGLADVFGLPTALTGSYDESARAQFQSVYAVSDPAASVARVIDGLF